LPIFALLSLSLSLSLSLFLSFYSYFSITFFPPYHSSSLFILYYFETTKQVNRSLLLINEENISEDGKDGIFIAYNII